MGVTADQFVADAVGNRIQIKALLLPSDLGMQHHLQQQIPQLFLHLGIAALADRIGHFMGLFQHVGHQRGMGLLQIPGTARCWIPELGHNIDQSLDGVRRSVGHAGATTGATPTFSSLSFLRPFLGPGVAIEDQVDPGTALQTHKQSDELPWVLMHQLLERRQQHRW